MSEKRNRQNGIKKRTKKKKERLQEKSSMYQVMQKGSHTVEAAVIMGMSFLVIGTILYLGSFFYGRACLTAHAYEQAYTGRLLMETGFFGYDNIDRSYEFLEKKRTVIYEAKCSSAWGGFQKEFKTEAVVNLEDPVTFIRIWQLGKNKSK